MKTLILVPIWKRPAITRIWAEGMRQFMTPDVSVLCILSKEDPDFDQNKEIVEDFDYCYYANFPISDKLNAGIEYSLQFEWDYLMNLGSDDLIHPAIWALYRPFLNKNYPFFGLDKVYFYDTFSKKLAISVPYTWGAGRMIHREIIENMRKKGHFLYESHNKEPLNRGLDCNSIENVQKFLNISYKQVETNDFPYLVDIKSDTGLSDFTLLNRFYTLTDIQILNQFPKKMLTWLHQ